MGYPCGCRYCGKTEGLQGRRDSASPPQQTVLARGPEAAHEFFRDREGVPTRLESARSTWGVLRKRGAPCPLYPRWRALDAIPASIQSRIWTGCPAVVIQSARQLTWVLCPIRATQQPSLAHAVSTLRRCRADLLLTRADAARQRWPLRRRGWAKMRRPVTSGIAR